LLQELRVAQTGVQILFAFLLAIAFQNRFASLHSYQRGIYLVTVANLTTAIVCAAVLGVLLVALWSFLPFEVRRKRPSPEYRTE
jgi:hypothetical protein